jgi:SAM-dependent methyltransferase
MSPLSISLSRHALPVWFIAILAQVLATAMVIMMLFISGWQLSVLEAGLLQGACAAAAGHMLGLPKWWIPIHLGFMPGLAGLLSLNINPGWFLAAFAILFVVYGAPFRSRVPLYLSGEPAWEAVASLVPNKEGLRFLDVGSGLGGLLCYLSRRDPKGFYEGIEAAPLPYLISRLRCLATAGGCRVFWGDFWKQGLAEYDAVFAFLSPVPMERLWEKACREMKPGSLFISYGFPIPDIQPDSVIEIPHAMPSTLYVWKL